MHCEREISLKYIYVTSVVLLLSFYYMYHYKLGFLILVSLTVFILNIGESSFYSNWPAARVFDACDSVCAQEVVLAGFNASFVINAL